MIMDYLLKMEMKKPLSLFLVGFFFATISILVSAALFSHSPSLVVVTFMTLPLVYVFTNFYRKEARKESKMKSFKKLFHENIGIAELYLYLFIGMAFGVAFWFSFFPKTMVATLFSEQIFNLNQIGVATGFFINDPSAAAATTGMRPDVFSLIAINNIKLVVLCAMMSFVFGAGALFILSWNASVVGVAIGLLVVRAKTVGSMTAIAILKGFTLGVSYYILHLVPEVVAYFYASVAGAFIASAMLKHKPFSGNSKRLLMISAGLLGVSILLILIGALIEVNISHTIQAAYS